MNLQFIHFRWVANDLFAGKKLAIFLKMLCSLITTFVIFLVCFFYTN